MFVFVILSGWAVVVTWNKSLFSHISKTAVSRITWGRSYSDFSVTELVPSTPRPTGHRLANASDYINFTPTPNMSEA